jgi:hypothetical protein
MSNRRLNIRRTAECLGIHESTLRGWEKKGLKFRTSPITKRKSLYEEDFEEFRRKQFGYESDDRKAEWISLNSLTPECFVITTDKTFYIECLGDLLDFMRGLNKYSKKRILTLIVDPDAFESSLLEVTLKYLEKFPNVRIKKDE